MTQDITQQLNSKKNISINPTSAKLKKRKISLLKCPRMPLAELSGLLQPFTKDDISLLSLSTMDLLSSLVLTLDNWPTLFATAYSLSVTVKSYNDILTFSLSDTHTHTRTHTQLIECDRCILYLNLHRKHLCKEGQRRSASRFAYAAPQSEQASVTHSFILTSGQFACVHRLIIQCKHTLQGHYD